MQLFNVGDFKLSSGGSSLFKIDCDALCDEDYAALARAIYKQLPDYRVAFGIPRGGMAFTRAMNKYSTHRLSDPILIVDDVLTTGGSMERFMVKEANAIGLVLFSRAAKLPPNVQAVFQMQVGVK